VRDNRLIATGYNGTDPGSLLSCLAGHCPRVTEAPDPYTPYHNCIATHAEINCIQQAFKAYGGARFVLYVTREPCPECWRVLKVYCHTIYRVVWPGGEQ
jgi:deoxycytidylate deaminase